MAWETRNSLFKAVGHLPESGLIRLSCHNVVPAAGSALSYPEEDHCLTCRRWPYARSWRWKIPPTLCPLLYKSRTRLGCSCQSSEHFYAAMSSSTNTPPGSPAVPPTPHIPTIPLPDIEDLVLSVDNPSVVMHPLLTIEPGHIEANFAIPLSERIAPGYDGSATHAYATRPPTSSLKITCHPLGKELLILPGEPITVLQVLNWIHRWLHEPMTDAAYHELDPILQQRVNATYVERCLAVGEPRIRDVEFRGGRKAVDLLCGLRIFGGLFPGDHGTWELRLNARDEVNRLGWAPDSAFS
jgi:hypothetical protein